ncbi:MAG: hypothetical protein ACK41X_22175 [Pseudorhodoplanes sp.]
MATFLKVVSGTYLFFVWLAFTLVVSGVRVGLGGSGDDIGPIALIAFLICITLSIPAVALYAFGQVVADVRTMRQRMEKSESHLFAMRSYYEPQA